MAVIMFSNVISPLLINVDPYQNSIAYVRNNEHCAPPKPSPAQTDRRHRMSVIFWVIAAYCADTVNCMENADTVRMWVKAEEMSPPCPPPAPPPPAAPSVSLLSYCWPAMACIWMADAAMLTGNTARTTRAIFHEALRPKARPMSSVKAACSCRAIASPDALYGATVGGTRGGIQR